MSNNFQNKIWHKSLDDIMSESFGKYAKYIIQDRALPDIRDGLKPVQRRILFAMHELNITHNKPYKKSARTVGEVIGKYHPHGDSSIYEAMVRMSQEWKNNIPLLDMQGNKGSIDGDSAAAMRYTECRLSKFGEYLLHDIEKNTVKFIPNFDDSENEPCVLPTLLPNVLVNGGTGIAAGYATNIPPFNLDEIIQAIIYRINHPNCTINQIANIVPGPDFPTGGIIQGKEGIHKMFATGRGKFNILAKIEEATKQNKHNTKQLIITEIPYEANKIAIVKSIEELKLNNELPGLKEIRDDSDKNGISIVLEFETDKDTEIIKNFLYKKTQLQISYSANIILIKNRKPVQCGILDIIDSYINHTNEMIIRSSIFDFKKAIHRKEILEGLIKTIKDIDNLVNLIKSSQSKDEARTKLIEHYDLTVNQAEAVLQLRLYTLTSYDTEKLIDEYNELLTFIETKLNLINDNKYRQHHIVDILKKYSSELNFKRRSLIEDEITEFSIDKKDIIEEKHGICIVTNDCYIKYLNESQIENIDFSKLHIKDGDIPIDIFKLSSLDTLVVLTNKGKCVTIPAHEIKRIRIRENGVHVNEFITLDSLEKVVCAFSVNLNKDIDTEIFVATKKSFVKRFLIQDILLGKTAKSTTYVGLKNDDEVINAFVVDKQAKEIITFTSSGYSIRYNINEVPVVGKNATGVRNINLKNNDNVAAVLPISNDGFILLISNRGAKRFYFNEIPLSGRATIGKRILSQVESNPYIIHSAYLLSSRDEIYVLKKDNTLSIAKASEIPITDATTRMNSFHNITGEIKKSSFLDINKNIISDSENNNFLSLLNEKQEDKKEDVKVINSDNGIDELINKHIKFENLIDMNVILENEPQEIIDLIMKNHVENNVEEEIQEIHDQHQIPVIEQNNVSTAQPAELLNDEITPTNENIQNDVHDESQQETIDNTNLNDELPLTEFVDENQQQHLNGFDQTDELEEKLSASEIENNEIIEIDSIEQDSTDFENDLPVEEPSEEIQQDSTEIENELLVNEPHEEIQQDSTEIENDLSDDKTDEHIQQSIIDIENDLLDNEPHEEIQQDSTDIENDLPVNETEFDVNDSLNEQAISENDDNEISEQAINVDDQNNYSNIQEDNNIYDNDFDLQQSDNNEKIEHQNNDESIQQEIDIDNKQDDLSQQQTNMSLIEALLSNDYQLFDKLIEDNVDVNEVDEDGQTALMIVANAGNINYVKKLLEKNADPNIQDKTYGFTALMYATQNKNKEIISELVKHNADINISAQDDITALKIAIEYFEDYDFAKFLIKKGAKSNDEYDKILKDNFIEDVESSILKIGSLDDEEE